MRNGDAATIQDVGEDPWQSDDCDLFALADGTGKIVALHTTTSLSFPSQLLRIYFIAPLRRGILLRGGTAGKRLYQVVLQNSTTKGPLPAVPSSAR